MKSISMMTGLVGLAVLAQANVRTEIPPDAGPPFYTYIQRLVDGSPFFFHDNEWVAISWLRDPSCVPPAFNLLDTNDFTPAFPGGPPRWLLCPLTVHGFAIWKNGPPPIDFVPMLSSLQGNGAVPIWFARLSEVQAAAADDNLTITELLALPSLRKGHAGLYQEITQPGTFRPQGEGNGKIEVTASGALEDGTLFQIEFREMGVINGNGVSFIRHARIDFR